MTTVAINNLWNYLNGLTLTRDETSWLANKLKQKADRLSTKADATDVAKNKALKDKFKGLSISPEVKKLRGSIKLKPEEMDDERVLYILNR